MTIKEASGSNTRYKGLTYALRKVERIAEVVYCLLHYYLLDPRNTWLADDQIRRLPAGSRRVEETLLTLLSIYFQQLRCRCNE